MLLQCKHILVDSSQRWLLYSLMRSFRKLHCRLFNQNFQSENVTHDFKWWIKLFLNINLTYNSFTLYIILPLTGWSHVLVMYVKENIHPCSCSGAESPVWTENSCILFSSVRHQPLLVIQQHWTRTHTHTRKNTHRSRSMRDYLQRSTRVTQRTVCQEEATFLWFLKQPPSCRTRLLTLRSLLDKHEWGWITFYFPENKHTGPRGEHLTGSGDHNFSCTFQIFPHFHQHWFILSAAVLI